MVTHFSYSLLLGAAIYFLFIAYHDFKNWKITNRSVLIATGIFILFAASTLLNSEPGHTAVDLLDSLYAAGILFGLGVVLWLFRLFGAGDAKLLFPIGLFLGTAHLFNFAIGLIVFGVIATVLRLVAKHIVIKSMLAKSVTGIRINEIVATGKIPYAVIMVIPVVALIYVRYVGI